LPVQVPVLQVLPMPLVLVLQVLQVRQVRQVLQVRQVFQVPAELRVLPLSEPLLVSALLFCSLRLQ
jgi:hypothetical protein